MHLKQCKVQKEKCRDNLCEKLSFRDRNYWPIRLLCCQRGYRLQAERARPLLCENVAGSTVNKSGISKANTAHGSKTRCGYAPTSTVEGQKAAGQYSRTRSHLLLQLLFCSQTVETEQLHQRKKRRVYMLENAAGGMFLHLGTEKTISHIHLGESPLKAFGTGEDKTWKRTGTPGTVPVGRCLMCQQNRPDSPSLAD